MESFAAASAGGSYLCFDSFQCPWYWQTEMISDSIDGALDDDELEDETDDLTNQVAQVIVMFNTTV